MERILATLPTYNESLNIRPLIQELLALGPGYEILVIDDHSPDGTWQIVEEISKTEPRVHLLHRTTERGRGTAGLAGFLWARTESATRQHAFQAVVEMDADFSHQPCFIPSLAKPILDGEFDVVVGSRLVPGGGEVGRPKSRQWITWAANTYIRLLLRLPLKDCTSGFRVFSHRAIATIPWERMEAKGPEIVQEVLLQARKAKLPMTERPILFEERRAGQSTFNAKIMARSLFFVLRRAIFG